MKNRGVESVPLVVLTPPFFTKLYLEMVETKVASYSCKSSSNQDCVFRMMMIIIIIMMVRIIVTMIIIILITTTQQKYPCYPHHFSIYSLVPSYILKITSVPLTNSDKFMRRTGLMEQRRDSMWILITAIIRSSQVKI